MHPEAANERVRGNSRGDRILAIAQSVPHSHRSSTAWPFYPSPLPCHYLQMLSAQQMLEPVRSQGLFPPCSAALPPPSCPGLKVPEKRVKDGGVQEPREGRAEP